MDRVVVAFSVLEGPPDRRLWIVCRCPFCGERHAHGAGGVGDDPRAFLGARRSHCLDGGGQYDLVELPPDTPRPEPARRARRWRGRRA